MIKSIPCRKAYKFRLEPTELEALELERTASVARYAYNWALRRCQDYYQRYGKGKPWAELSAELTQLKQTELWLYDFDSQMLQQALADLRRAYINFFERRAKFPTFKKKRRPDNRFVSPSGFGLRMDVSIYRFNYFSCISAPLSPCKSCGKTARAV